MKDFVSNHVPFLIFCLILGIILFLGNERKEKISGLTQSILIKKTRRVINPTRDDGIGAAVMGGLLFGTTGAIIGYAGTRDDGKDIVIEKISACKITIEIDNKMIRHLYSVPRRCESLKEDEIVNIRKYTRIWDIHYYLGDEKIFREKIQDCRYSVYPFLCSIRKTKESKRANYLKGGLKNKYFYRGEN